MMLTRREAVVGMIGAGLAPWARAAEAATVAQRTVAFGDSGVFIQHVYEKWQKLKVGMTEDEVTELLGPPLLQPESDPEFAKNPRVRGENEGYLWEYGWLDFRHPSVTTVDRFTVMLQEGKVFQFDDPFQGELSSDGKPTVPKLVVPIAYAILRHYPRYLDLRWLPPSGEYPMSFDVELDFGQHTDKANAVVVLGHNLEFHNVATHKVHAPYAVDTFVGKNMGRWRVRAANEIGASEWSEYRYFQFDR